MNPNKQTIPDDEIDLREIILTLRKEKYLVLIITLVFTVAGYIYGTLQPKFTKPPLLFEMLLRVYLLNKKNFNIRNNNKHLLPQVLIMFI